MKRTVADRGQITIPKQLRQRLGVKPGTVLEFREDHGRLILSKAAAPDPAGDVYGCLGRTIHTDAVMARIRGPR